MLIFSWWRKVITELKLLRYFVLGLFKLLRLKRILHFLHQYCSQHRTTHDQQYASGGKLNFNSIRPPESFTDSGLFQHEFFRSHKQLQDFSGPQKVRTLNFRAFFRPVATLFKCLLAILDIFAFVVTVIINFLLFHTVVDVDATVVVAIVYYPRTACWAFFRCQFSLQNHPRLILYC